MEDEILKNEKIAELIVEKLWEDTITDTEFAFQLFVERFVLPNDFEGYTKNSMENMILEALNKRDLSIEWKKTSGI